MLLVLMKDMLTGSDYNQLRALVAVSHTLNFSRAAEKLGVTPSSLSQMIRGLEESIGVQLLHRTTRSVSLTVAGEHLLRRAAPAIEELGDAVVQARRARERPSGTVRVVSFRSGAARYIEPILPDFLRRFPEIIIDLSINDEVGNVVTGGFDISLRIGEVIEHDMVAVHLGRELRQLAVASPEYIQEHGTPSEPRDLLHHSCIRWRWPGREQPYAWEFCETGRWFEVTVDGPLIVNDKEVARRAALAGVGIAFLIEDTLTDDLASGRLVALLEKWSAPFPGFFLCYPRQLQMAPALRAFIDAVRTSVKQHSS